MKSFRKPPMDPEKIASVFQAQAVMPEDVPTVIPGFGEDQSDPGEQTEGSGEEQEVQIKIAELISQLGAPEFAVREQATAGLRKLADDALPALRTAAIEHDDLEVRLRAEDVATGIVNSAVAGRIDSFLEGEPGSFEGWEVFQRVLGDGPRLREVFVEMMLRHEDLVQALEVSTEARMAALEKVIARVQRVAVAISTGCDRDAALLQRSRIKTVEHPRRSFAADVANECHGGGSSGRPVGRTFSRSVGGVDPALQPSESARGFMDVAAERSGTNAAVCGKDCPATRIWHR